MYGGSSNSRPTVDLGGGASGFVETSMYNDPSPTVPPLPESYMQFNDLGGQTQYNTQHPTAMVEAGSHSALMTAYKNLEARYLNMRDELKQEKRTNRELKRRLPRKSSDLSAGMALGSPNALAAAGPTSAGGSSGRSSFAFISGVMSKDGDMDNGIARSTSQEQDLALEGAVLDDMMDERSNAEENIKFLQLEVINAHKEKDNLFKQIRNLEDDNDMLTRKFDLVKEENRHLKESLKNFTQDKDDDISLSSKRIEILEREKSSLHYEVMKSRSLMEDERNTYKQENQTLRDRIQALERQLKDLKTQKLSAGKKNVDKTQVSSSSRSLSPSSNLDRLHQRITRLEKQAGLVHAAFKEYKKKCTCRTHADSGDEKLAQGDTTGLTYGLAAKITNHVASGSAHTMASGSTDQQPKQPMTLSTITNHNIAAARTAEDLLTNTPQRQYDSKSATRDQDPATRGHNTDLESHNLGTRDPDFASRGRLPDRNLENTLTSRARAFVEQGQTSNPSSKVSSSMQPSAGVTMRPQDGSSATRSMSYIRAAHSQDVPLSSDRNRRRVMERDEDSEYDMFALDPDHAPRSYESDLPHNALPNAADNEVHLPASRTETRGEGRWIGVTETGRVLSAPTDEATRAAARARTHEASRAAERHRADDATRAAERPRAMSNSSPPNVHSNVEQRLIEGTTDTNSQLLREETCSICNQTLLVTVLQYHEHVFACAAANKRRQQQLSSPGSPTHTPTHSGTTSISPTHDRSISTEATSGVPTPTHSTLNNTGGVENPTQMSPGSKGVVACRSCPVCERTFVIDDTQSSQQMFESHVHGHFGEAVPDVARARQAGFDTVDEVSSHV